MTQAEANIPSVSSANSLDCGIQGGVKVGCGEAAVAAQNKFAMRAHAVHATSMTDQTRKGGFLIQIAVDEKMILGTQRTCWR